MPIDMMGIDASEKNLAGDGFVSLTRVAQAGRRQETQTTSDFTYMADLTDRGVMVGYLDDSIPTTFGAIGYRRDTKDLVRGVSGSQTGRGRDYQLNAARTIPAVGEKGEYLPIDPSETYFNFATRKYGCQWDVSFEAWLADGRDLNILGDYPTTWGLSARYTEEFVFTSAYAGDTTFFTAGRGNYGTAALDEDSLDAGIAALRGIADPAGNVGHYAGPITLVVPPVLEGEARRLLNSAVVVSGAGGARPALNMVAGQANLEVGHFLPSIDTVAGTTAWYLFADPRIRPAVRYGYLDGFTEPEVYVKAAEAQRLAGGENPFDGTFLTDDIAFKLRFFFGADQADYRGAYMSDGTT